MMKKTKDKMMKKQIELRMTKLRMTKFNKFNKSFK